MKITRAERKALKQRRCIIEYRMRRDNTKAQTSLVNADIPFVQYQQRQLGAPNFPCKMLAIPHNLDHNKAQLFLRSPELKFTKSETNI